MINRAILTAVALGLALSSCVADPVVKCTPGYVKLTESPLEVQTDGYLIEIGTVLVGCREALEVLDDDDHRRIAEAIADLAIEYRLLFMAIARQEEFARLVLDRVNSGLEGAPITAVYFDRLGFGESALLPH